MKGSAYLWRLIRPFLKRWPILVFFVLSGLALGYRFLYYSIPKYQAGATLQINDKDSGPSRFLKQFESFSVTGQLLTEVEVLRSKYLLEKLIERLQLEIYTYQYVRGQKRNLYGKSPFQIQYELGDSTWLNRHIQLEVSEDQRLSLKFLKPGTDGKAEGRWGEPINLPGLKLTLDGVEASVPAGLYGFTINSRARLVSQLSGTDLVISLPEKEVAIVKIYFGHESPEFCADIVNALAETYIQDFITQKKRSAAQALAFIDQQVDTLERSLQASERELARFKTRHQVVDLAMETDASLKRIANLETRKLSLQLRQKQLQTLFQSLKGDSLADAPSPNYESVEDPAFTDLLIKLNGLKSTRADLLEKYTLSHPEVHKNWEEISRLQEQLTESVDKTLQTVETQLASVSQALDKANQSFSTLPGVEQELMRIKRRFLTNEQMYAYLMERRAEAAIGAASTLSFHRLLERAPVPTVPVSPQKGLIMGLSGMVGGILGLVIVFFLNYLTATVYHPSDIEDNLESPVIGIVRQIPAEMARVSQDFINLSTQIMLVKDVQILSVVAYDHKDGKSPIAINLAKSFAALGYETLLVDADLYRPSVHEYFHANNQVGLAQTVLENEAAEEVVQQCPVESLDIFTSGEPTDVIPTAVLLNPRFHAFIAWATEHYDRIILILPDLKEVRDAIPMMKNSDMSLMTLKADQTRMEHVLATEALIARFEIPNTQMLLIQGESLTPQTTYLLNDEPLPRIGKGARRTLLRESLRRLIFQRNPDGSFSPLPKIGMGSRRLIISGTIRRLRQKREEEADE